MIHELIPSRFDGASHLFGDKPHHVPAMAVLSRNYPGRVFVDDPEDPRVAVAWALTRWAYISGEARASSFLEMLPDLVDRVIIPDSRDLGQTWFELYCPDDPVWTRRIGSLLSAHRPESHHERLLVLDPIRFRSVKTPVLPAEARVERVRIPIVPEWARHSPLIGAEFRTRTTVGFVCRVDGSRVAVCRSNGLAAGRAFMVDVETPDPAHRGRGYARAAAHAMIEDSIGHGTTPLWETVEDNHASLHLARGLGFIEQERYPVYAIEF